MFATVESANIVGYQNSTFTSKKYNAVGPCFITTGDANEQFSMADIKAEGFDFMMATDRLYILNPNTCGAAKELVWLDDFMAGQINESYKAGWYEFGTFIPFTESFDIGTGFYTFFGSSTVKFTYSGEVYNESVTVGNKVNVDVSNKYMIIPNPCPRPVYWREITAEGFDFMMATDRLYVLNPDTCGAAVELVWLEDFLAKQVNTSYTAGWYRFPDMTPYGNEQLNPGEGVRAFFGSKDVKITFPKPIAD